MNKLKSFSNKSKCEDHHPPLPRGYKWRPEAKAWFKRWHATRLWLTLATALADMLGIALAAAAHLTIRGVLGDPTAAWLTGPMTGALRTGQISSSVAVIIMCLSWIPFSVLIARCLRGLENLTHDAAHCNWNRNWCKLNDLLGNLFAAVPVFQVVKDFRDGHDPHHGKTGGHDDPDHQRYAALGLESLDRSSAPRFIRDMMRRLAPYAIGYWQVVGMRWRSICFSLVWHLLLAILPLSYWIGLWQALAMWLVYFLAPFVLVLPVMRFVAEAGKHVYDGAGNVMDATVSNLGSVHTWLYHPHSDGYHVLHHLDPNIPHHRLAVVHRWLVANDPVYASRHRSRVRVLQTPETGDVRKEGR